MKIDARRAVHYIVVFLTLLYLISGLGITEFRIIGPLTGGLLDKVLSFQIHGALLIPFVVFLALHIYLALTGRKK